MGLEDWERVRRWEFNQKLDELISRIQDKVEEMKWGPVWDTVRMENNGEQIMKQTGEELCNQICVPSR